MITTTVSAQVVATKMLRTELLLDETNKDISCSERIGLDEAGKSTIDSGKESPFMKI
jgi:hypothetical protein